MSLKAFHIVFVVASILMSFGVAAWGVRHYQVERQLADLLLSVLSLLAGVGLVFYARAVLRKLKHTPYL